MNNSTSSSVWTKNITLKSWIAWLLGIIFIITGISDLFSNPVSSLFFLLAAAVLLPPVVRAMTQKTHISLSRNIRILLALAFLVLAGFNAKSDTLTSTPVISNSSLMQDTVPSPSPTSENINRKAVSIVFAKKVITDLLKSPSAARFVDVQAYELSNQKDVWAVNGYVDSQNSYGAMIRSMWEVQLDYREGKGGTVLSILFDGKKIQ